MGFGPQLAKYPVIKNFVMEEGMSYQGLEVIFSGGEPRMTVYDTEKKPVLRLLIGDLTRDELVEKLLAHGVYKIEEKTEL